MCVGGGIGRALFYCNKLFLGICIHSMFISQFKKKSISGGEGMGMVLFSQ